MFLWGERMAEACWQAKGLKSSNSFGQRLQGFPGSYHEVGRDDIYNAQNVLNLVRATADLLLYFIISSDLGIATFVYRHKPEKKALQVWRPVSLKPDKVCPCKGTLKIQCQLNYLDRFGVGVFIYLLFFMFAYVTIFYESLLASEVLQEVLAQSDNEASTRPKKYRAPINENLRLLSEYESWKLNSSLLKPDLGCDFLCSVQFIWEVSGGSLEPHIWQLLHCESLEQKQEKALQILIFPFWRTLPCYILDVSWG